MEKSLRVALIVTIFIDVYCKPVSVSDVSKPVVLLLKYDNQLREDGYDFEIETNDGFSRNENAKVDDTGNLNVTGDYFIRFPENKQFIFVEYKSGTNGFITKVSFGKVTSKSDRIPSAAIASIVGGGLG